MRTYKPLGGESIDKATESLVRAAQSTGGPACMKFNDVEIVAQPGDDPARLAADYMREMKRRHDEWTTSPEYAEQQRKAEEAQRRREHQLVHALATAPASMALRDEPAWRECVEKNQDPYGAAAVRYAETWARVMEARIDGGQTVEQCAEEASHIADTEGMTGFMYGCAVGILARVWVHGEELRRWHNLKTQIRNEGEKANESGGVLNPALLRVG